MKIIELIILLVLPASVFAENTDPIMKKYADELIVCASYYSTVSKYLPRDLSEKTKKMGATPAFLKAAQIIGSDIANKKYEIEKKKHEEFVDGNADKFEELMKKHAENCKQVLFSPEERIKYLRSKE